LEEYLPHAVPARGDRPELKTDNLHLAAKNLADRGECRRDRSVAAAPGGALAAPGPRQPDGRAGWDGAADDLEMGQLILLGRVVERVVEQREQILVEDRALAVGERGEPLVNLAQLFRVQLVAELAEALLQGVPAGVLAEDQGGLGDADR